jgi:hypothetical protein
MKAVFVPVFFLIALALLLLAVLARSRVAPVRGGLVAVHDIARGRNAWPDEITLLGNAYRNQFELPLLFYALVALEVATQKTDEWFIALEWSFVVLRFVHVYVHVANINLLMRIRFFAAGAFILLLMWAQFAMRILFT